jgi:hypothetical protein
MRASPGDSARVRVDRLLAVIEEASKGPRDEPDVGLEFFERAGDWWALLAEFKRLQRLERSVIDSAPEWEKANATLKHRLREVMAELEDLRSQVLAVLPRREA